MGYTKSYWKLKTILSMLLTLIFTNFYYTLSFFQQIIEIKLQIAKTNILLGCLLTE